MSNLRANLWKLYAYKFISEFYLVVPVLIPYYMAHGLSSTQVFTIQAAYALSVLVLEIPSGYLADVAGRKTTLVLGAVAMPLGLAVYAFSGTFLTFIFAEFLIAVANSMRSGSDSALIYDTLLQLKDEARYKRFEGRAFFFTRVGTASSAVLGGLAAILSLHLPFYINMVTCLIMLPMSIALVEPARSKLEAKNPLLDILRVAKFSFTHGELRRLILYGALVQSTCIIVVWASFLYYRALGISVGLFGVLFALFQLASAFGAKQAHSVEKVLGFRKALALPLLIGPIFLLMGAVRSLFIIPLIILYAFFWGLLYPILLDLLNRRIDSAVRATVLSVASMAGSLSYVVLAPIFGKLVDALSLSAAFLILGAYFLIYGLIALVSILQHLREE
jgi:MFS family permease